MKKISLYHLIENNKIKYIGLTINPNIRKNSHARKKPLHQFVVVDNFDNDIEAAQAEVEHISKYNTFIFGWNKTGGGEGYYMGLVSRKGIGGRKKGAGGVVWNKGVKNCFSKETIQKMSENRKGIQHSTKLNIDQVLEIRKLWLEKAPVSFEVGKIMTNGIKMSYLQAFSKTYAENYNITPQNIKKIVLRESWINV
jgi:hypothetical protein